MGARAFVALGSNLGDRRGFLDGALRELGTTPGVRVVACSRWHDTEAIGGPAGQARFLNGVLELEVELAPRALLARLHELEAQAGRERVEVHGPRTLDLDLLLYDAQRIDEPDLSVPHPLMEERAFVLAPLADIAPQLRLPGCGLSVRERLAQIGGPR